MNSGEKQEVSQSGKKNSGEKNFKQKLRMRKEKEGKKKTSKKDKRSSTTVHNELEAGTKKNKLH